jgi:hypothetical protein
MVFSRDSLVGVPDVSWYHIPSLGCALADRRAAGAESGVDVVKVEWIVNTESFLDIDMRQV